MNPELEKLIEKYLKGKCSEEESRIVEEWYNRLNEDDGNAVETWNSKAKGLKAGLYKKISIGNHKTRELVFFRAAAAAVIILIGVAALFYLNTKETDTRAELLSYAISGKVDVGNLKETRLILDEDRAIDLEGNADIQYAEKELIIQAGEEGYNQRIETDKTAYSTLVVPYGRKADVTLSDGTKVWLNSGSRLVYPNNFKGSKREVFLQGEAFFDVAHNKEKPFHVYAKDVDVKVLGTSFNVRAYNDEPTLKTVLVEGSVALSGAGSTNNAVQLTPGRMAVYEAGKPFSLSNVNTEIYTSWKDGYLYLQNEPLQNLLKTLVRYYNIPVQLENTQEERSFSGRLNLQADIKEVIEIITLTTGYDAEKTERGWLLKRSTDQL